MLWKKLNEVQIAKNVTKFHLRITAKCHALQSSDLDKTLERFQKDPGKIVGGVGCTRYPVSVCFNP